LTIQMSILHIYRQHRQKRKTLTIRNPLCFSFVFCFCFCFFLWGWGDFYERLWYGPLIPILDTKVTWWLMSMQAAALCWVSQMFQGFSFQTNNIYPQSNLAFSSTVIIRNVWRYQRGNQTKDRQHNGHKIPKG
jgi:hypothetical protein